MPYNPRLDALHPYPFTRLNALLEGVTVLPEKSKISLAIGEPQHLPPQPVMDTLIESLSEINRYPTTRGLDELRLAIVDWLQKRYRLNNGLLSVANVLPVVGTREALFAIAQCLVNVECSPAKPLVLMPSPFYQIYEGAAIMAGADPYYLPASEGSGFQPDFSLVPDDIWQRCQLLYLCNPSNPTGATLSVDDYRELLALAVRFDFVICSDECYSEIYPDEEVPTSGLLEAIDNLPSDHDKQSSLEHCLVFNSLSKRSNLAGMRSGFVAGGEKLIERFLLYRTYHGSAMPLHHQAASITAWRDEAHVVENRDAYREKIELACELIKSVPQLSLVAPQGGFCLWLKVPGCDQEFTKWLFQIENVVVLPGSFLARSIGGCNAGSGYVRIAMVQTKDICLEAIERLCRFANTLK